MLYLARKFSSWFILYLLIYMVLLFPLLNYSRMMQDQDPMEPIYLFYQGSFIFWVVIGAIWVHENMEEKTRGYAFLRTLPLRTETIVLSKFLVVFLTVAFFLAYHLILYAVFFDDPGYIALVNRYYTIMASFCLILSAFTYIGLFRFGFQRFGKIVLVGWLLIFLSPLFFREVIQPTTGLEIAEIIRWITGLRWLPVVVAVIGFYWLLMLIAVKSMRKKQA